MQTLLVCWVALSFGLGAVWALLAARIKQAEVHAHSAPLAVARPRTEAPAVAPLRTAAPAAARPRTAAPAVAPARACVLRLVEDDPSENSERRGAGTRTRVSTAAR